MTVIAAAAVGATLWLCVLIARAHLLGYIYVLLCYVIVPWTVLRCLTARSLDADSVSWCVLVLVCVCRGYFTVPLHKYYLLLSSKKFLHIKLYMCQSIILFIHKINVI